MLTKLFYKSIKKEVKEATIKEECFRKEGAIYAKAEASKSPNADYERLLAKMYGQLKRAVEAHQGLAPQTSAQAALPADADAYWAKLEELRQHGTLALQYVKTLRKTIAQTDAKVASEKDPAEIKKLQDKKKYYDVVLRYCLLFAKACGDSRESYSVRPNLQMLLDIERLLAHLRRPATPKPAAEDAGTKKMDVVKKDAQPDVKNECASIPSAVAGPVDPEADDRVTMWDTKKQSKISGNAAPMKRNIPKFLKKYPNCEVYSNQVGADRSYFPCQFAIP